MRLVGILERGALYREGDDDDVITRSQRTFLPAERAP